MSKQLCLQVLEEGGADVWRGGKLWRIRRQHQEGRAGELVKP